MTSTPPAAATLPDPQSQTAADVVSRCQGMLDTVFRDEIAALKANGCALVDFPDHGNVGDRITATTPPASPDTTL